MLKDQVEENLDDLFPSISIVHVFLLKNENKSIDLIKEIYI